MKFYKEKKYQEYLKNFFKIITVFIFLDVFSTFLFVRQDGIFAEGNFIGRFILLSFGGYSYLFLFLVSFFAHLLVYSFMYCLLKNREDFKEMMFYYLGIISGIYLLCLYINFRSLF